jgi:hypothetical protein
LRIQPEIWSFAFPKNDAAHGEFPYKGSEIAFGSTITNEVKLYSVVAFEKVFQMRRWLDLFKRCSSSKDCQYHGRPKINSKKSVGGVAEGTTFGSARLIG